MPTVDYEIRLSGQFVCPTPASASPAQKGAHQVLKGTHPRWSHCAIDLVVGTRGVHSDRTDHNFYHGHCPDSPVMLGSTRTATYAAAKSATGFSLKSCVAIVAAGVVGACGGAITAGTLLGVIAGIHHLNGAWLVAVTLETFIRSAIVFGLIGASMAMRSDSKDWATAHQRFATLHAMSQAAERLKTGTRRPGEDAGIQSQITAGLQSTDWSLQQAALELEALFTEAKPEPSAAETAKAQKLADDAQRADYGSKAA